MSLRREHALEMGGTPDKDPPFFFTKPPDAAVDVSAGGAVVPFPPETQDLQHEVEMVVAIGRGVCWVGAPPDVFARRIIAEQPVN